MNLITIATDYEYAAAAFWAELDQAFPTIAQRLRESEEPIEITASEWEAIQRLPRFASGPAYARHALIVRD